MWFVNGFMRRRMRLWERLAGEMELASGAGCGRGPGGSDLPFPSRAERKGCCLLLLTSPGPLRCRGWRGGPCAPRNCTSAPRNLHLALQHLHFSLAAVSPLFPALLRSVGGTAWAGGQRGGMPRPLSSLEHRMVEVRVVGLGGKGVAGRWERPSCCRLVLTGEPRGGWVFLRSMR